MDVKTCFSDRDFFGIKHGLSGRDIVCSSMSWYVFFMIEKLYLLVRFFSESAKSPGPGAPRPLESSSAFRVSAGFDSAFGILVGFEPSSAFGVSAGIDSAFGISAGFESFHAASSAAQRLRTAVRYGPPRLCAYGPPRLAVAAVPLILAARYLNR